MSVTIHPPEGTPDDSFALLYHTHHSGFLEDLPFWLELASRQGGRILELGCGTGRVLLPLAQAGYPVYGLDIDPAMLAVLRDKLDPVLRSRVFVWVADLADFYVEQRFKLILLPCNTFTTLSSQARQAMLKLVHRHLLPGGLFAASLPNPAMLMRMPARGEPELEETFLHPVDGEPVQVSSSWQRDGQAFTVEWNYDHLQADGRIKRLSVHTRHYLEPVQTYLEEMLSAGMEILASYGDFDKSPYNNRSPQLILVAVKRS